ncbi:beta strand repeat-containing protein [Verrucomicrobium spinosum]|uniref:beta strand repeat-containing protein n=1 Tax=Verrucomicrobium spinosum TaxID=2736 RepID=UPI0009462663|nr:autotransporter-associated beta strand repeat-containing protein [Verrucomicrobium spinosum]
MSGLSTYTGSTTVSGGTLALDLGTNTTGVLASASTLTLGGGTLSVKGVATGLSSQTLGNLTLTAGTSSSIVINNNGGSSTTLTLGNTWTVGTGARLFVDLSSGAAVLASNPSSLLTNGLLTFVVVKDATATGFGTISSGQIVRATTAELRNNSNDGAVNFITQVGHTDYAGTTLTMLAGTHLLNSLTINTDPGAGTLVLTGTSLTFNNNTLLITGANNFAITGGTLGASAAAMGLHHIGTGTLTLSSSISSGAGSLTKTGTGTVALTGTNAYTGGTTINEGTLSVSGGTALADTGAVTLANNATAVFQVNASETIGTLNGGGALGGNVVLSAGTLTSSFTTGTATFNGIISGAGAFTKAGAGILVLGGANTYAGLTTVDGILRITNASALGNTGSTTQTTVAATGRVELSGGITVVNEDITITGVGNSSQGGLHASSGVNVWTGQVILGSSPSRLGASGNATLVISGKITDGVNTFNLAIRTADSSTFSNIVEVSNAGNDYGGSTDVVVGVLRIAGGNNRLPTGTVLNIGNGSNVDRARFDLNGFNQEIAGLSIGAGASTMLKNVHSATAATLTINNTSNYSFDGSITGAVSLVKTGTAVQTLTLTNLANGASSYTGTTTVNGGILRAGVAGAFSANSAVTLADTAGATLDLAGFAQTIASLAGGGVNGGNVTLGSATLTTGGNNSSTTYDGVISGGGGLVKVGSGAFKLTRANTYTGTTTVNAGALIVNGSTSTGAMNVSGTLGGNGTVGGVTTLLTGGSLNPGDPDSNGGIGKLTLSQGVTLNTGSSSTLEIRGATFTSTNNFGGNAIGTDGYNTYVRANGVGQGDHDQLSVTGTFVQQNGAGIDVVPVTGFTATYGRSSTCWTGPPSRAPRFPRTSASLDAMAPAMPRWISTCPI